MKVLLVLCIFFSLFIFSHAQDKTVYLSAGNELFERNSQNFSFKDNVKKEEVFLKRFYKFIQFNTIPTEQEIETLKTKGIKLLNYIPKNTYIASISTKVKDHDLKNINIRSIQEITIENKMSEAIRLENYPLWAINGNVVEVVVKTYKDIQFSIFKEKLLDFGVKLTSTIESSNLIIGKIDRSQVKDLVALPFIHYVEPISEPGKVESNDGRNLHRSNAIDVDYFGGRKYNGEGVNVAINDDGFVGPHIDFTGRTNQLDVLSDLTGTHGDMTTGIIGGAGNLDPIMKGMATGAYIHVRQYVSSMSGTVPLHLDSNVLVFSSSYSNGCNGGYTSTTELVDQEIYNNEALMQVFSAGNSNNNDCGYGAGSSWGNITGGHKIGKNVIAVANLQDNDNIAGSSSRGPASDGRIKPDISAHGAGHMSTDPNNMYSPGGGTSAAAPGVAGVLAQLHHAHRDLYGSVANSGLLKAAMLVTANDLGNEGPDFIYGWGKVNALKALRLVEETRFIVGVVNQGTSQNHTLSIPNNIKRVKVMVYWVDNEASTLSSQALVNDLDLSVTDPNSTIHLPWILDHTPNPNLLSLPATRGEDHLNNMEEVEILNPMAGNYNLTIDGTTVPFGSQEYFLVYEFVQDDIEVVFPIGGEGLLPNTTERIHWDADGVIGDFLIEYTDDDGVTWNTIQSNVNGSSRFYNWTIPNTISGEARVRVSRAGRVGESYENFTIMDRPENIAIVRACYSTSSIEVSWDAVSGATSYDVFLLGNKYMDSVTNTTSLNAYIPVADLNESHWVSVRARGVNNAVSLRQIAIRQDGLSQGGCLLSCLSDHDIGVKSILNPTSELFLCSDSIGVEVQVEIENTGLFNESNFQVKYQYGNQSISTFNYSSSLAIGNVAVVTFPLFYITTTSTENLKVWTALDSDSTFCNDTTILSLQASSLFSSLPLIEDFESSSFPSSRFTIANPDNNRTWQDITVDGANGVSTSAAYVNNYSYNSRGAKDFLNLIPIDLTQFGNTNAITLTFDVAHRTFGTIYNDSLVVEVSTDCGLTFFPIYEKGGASLSTGGSSNGTWSPSASSDWRNEQLDLSLFVGNEVFVRFVNICDYGQNLYLDNINIKVIGPPVSQFDYNLINSCSRQVVFNDLSTSSPTQWLWNFGDGTTSTLQNPTHTFASIGIYNVSLQITNVFGGDVSNQTVEIEESISTFPIIEDFEENTSNSFLSRIINSDNLITWDSVNVFGSNGVNTGAVMLNNYSYNDIGQEDKLELYDFNFSSLQTINSAYLYFDIAYRQYSDAFSDSLKINISTDCGQTFSRIYYKGGSDIAGGVDVTSSNWSPQVITDWVSDSVDLSSYSGSSIIIRFVNVCGFGQKMFLDNINIKAFGSYVGVEELNKFNIEYSITPNPAHNIIQLLLNKSLENDLKLTILSAEGKFIKNITLLKGEKEKNIPLFNLSPALYFIQLESQGMFETRKLIIQ